MVSATQSVHVLWSSVHVFLLLSRLHNLPLRVHRVQRKVLPLLPIQQVRGECDRPLRVCGWLPSDATHPGRDRLFRDSREKHPQLVKPLYVAPRYRRPHEWLGSINFFQVEKFSCQLSLFLLRLNSSLPLFLSCLLSILSFLASLCPSTCHFKLLSNFRFICPSCLFMRVFVHLPIIVYPPTYFFPACPSTLFTIIDFSVSFGSSVSIDLKQMFTVCFTRSVHGGVRRVADGVV